MKSLEDVLSFMDLLDLDEEVIDSRLKTILLRTSFTKNHLQSAIHLLQYKHLINLQEGTECENDEECDFVAKLICNLHVENADNVCKITNIVLSLNSTSLVSKSEHFLQQILSNIDFSSKHKKTTDDAEDGNSLEMLLYFKLCDSILDANIGNNKKLSLFFLETPLETVIDSGDDKLSMHFLTNTVPRLFEVVTGYNIVDRIWSYLKQIKNKAISLKVLSCLSDFYLPITDKGNVKYDSEMTCQREFWDVILCGLSSNDPSERKISVYLAKRAVDCVINLRKDIHVKFNENTLFRWEHKHEKKYKNIWDNYFTLIDSLEEKQSNIVLPSLQLFKILNGIGTGWLNCAFNIGLKHDNTQVRLKCIEYRLKMKISNELEALTLLEALNDINLFDEPVDREILKEKIHAAFQDMLSFKHIFKAFTLVKWSPVPLYHLSDIIAKLHLKGWVIDFAITDVCQTIIDVLKIPCNVISIRRAVHINILYFIINCCKNVAWKECVNILSNFQLEYLSEQTTESLMQWINNNLKLNKEDTYSFLQVVANTTVNLNFILLYLDKHEEDIFIFTDIINENINKMSDINKRQYCDKRECLDQVISLMSLLNKVRNEEQPSRKCIFKLIHEKHTTILQYILSLLSGDTVISIEEISLLFKELDVIIMHLKDDDAIQILLELYKRSIVFLKDNNTCLEKTVFSLFIFNNILNDSFLLKYCHHEILNLKKTLNIMMNTIENVSKKQSKGRLRNIIYEKSSEIVYRRLKHVEVHKQDLKEIVIFIEQVVECGGYGCLKWILKIVNNILKLLIEDENVDFSITQFIDRSWKEIEELKSNNQYAPCMREFVNLITQDALLKNIAYNNIVTLYCSKILDYAQMKNTPLYYLVKELNNKNLSTDLGHIIYIFSEILLFCPVPKKDQRIIENVVVEILHNPKLGVHEWDMDMYFNYQIQYLSVLILCKLNESEIYTVISSLILNKIDTVFINKMRYHGNSQLHRTLLTALQHLLMILLLDKSKLHVEKIANWCIEILGKLPHQPSVRICLEWFIALYYILKEIKLNNESLQRLKDLPLTSQFIILFWVIIHKIVRNSYDCNEYEFVMDTLLTHTMGQMFNIRLHAQYLAMKLYKLRNNDEISKKYAYIIKVIEKTFIENSKDKNFLKLQEDYFVNQFDVLTCWTPSFIYYFLPRYHAVAVNETVDLEYIRNIFIEINSYISNFDSLCVSDDELHAFNYNRNFESKLTENAETVGTIQKKYIPWKNMSEIEIYTAGKKKESKSDLIVVASLIDKLPNLGGMARTSEVFDVKTYVVDSLRHIQDRQFQGLSVSAERWINIEEVRPGPPLKEYLIRMKTEGYSVVAAEQTSNSCALQNFKFPKKTLLLLGHEKEGVPCDLLPMMDFCVEIPQQGFVRSLNVHVTAAIFIWEYTRQNILRIEL